MGQELEKLDVVIDANVVPINTALMKASQNLRVFGQTATSSMVTAQTGVKNLTGSVNTLANAFKGFLALAAVGAVVAGIKKASDAYGEAEEAATRLNNAVAANTKLNASASQELQNYASKLQLITRFDDDAINKATATMLQFTHSLDVKQIEALQRAAIGLADTTGMDLDAAFKKIGISVGTNTNALKKWGITLTDGASESKRLQEITEQLGGKFDQAVANSDTLTGAQAKLNNQIGEVWESLGKMTQAFGLNKEETDKATIAVTGFVDFLTKHLPDVENFATQTKSAFAIMAQAIVGDFANIQRAILSTTLAKDKFRLSVLENTPLGAIAGNQQVTQARKNVLAGEEAMRQNDQLQRKLMGNWGASDHSAPRPDATVGRDAAHSASVTDSNGSKKSSLHLQSIGIGGFQLDKTAAENFRAADKAFYDHYGRHIAVISAYRDAIKNAAVGGAPNSNHLKGKSFDIAQSDIAKASPYLNWAGFKALGGKYFNPKTGKYQSEDNHFNFTGSEVEYQKPELTDAQKNKNQVAEDVHKAVGSLPGFKDIFNMDVIYKFRDESRNVIAQINEQLVSKGKELTESLKTPFEKYNETIKGYKDLLDSGNISQETYNKAISEANDILGGYKNTQDKFNDIQKRYQENLALINGMQGENVDKLKLIQRATREATEATRDLNKELDQQTLNRQLRQDAKNPLNSIGRGLQGASGLPGFFFKSDQEKRETPLYNKRRKEIDDSFGGKTSEKDGLTPEQVEDRQKQIDALAESFTAVGQQAQAGFQYAGQALGQFGNMFSQTMVNGIMSGNFAWKELGKSMIAAIAGAIIKLTAFIAIAAGAAAIAMALPFGQFHAAQVFADTFHLLAGFGGGGGKGGSKPGRAFGGPMSPNQPYLVGERGLELFVPNGSGLMINNRQLNQQQQSITVQNNITIQPGLDAAIEAGTRRALNAELSNITNATVKSITQDAKHRRTFGMQK